MKPTIINELKKCFFKHHNPLRYSVKLKLLIAMYSIFNLSMMFLFIGKENYIPLKIAIWLLLFFITSLITNFIFTRILAKEKGIIVSKISMWNTWYSQLEYRQFVLNKLKKKISKQLKSKKPKKNIEFINQLVDKQSLNQKGDGNNLFLLIIGGMITTLFTLGIDWIKNKPVLVVEIQDNWVLVSILICQLLLILILLTKFMQYMQNRKQLKGEIFNSYVQDIKLQYVAKK